MSEALLRAEGIRRSFASADSATGPNGSSVEVLQGVSLEAGRGEFISIMGPSGSGKSTLLQILGGLDRPSGGTVRIDGQFIQGLGDVELSRFRRRRLGFIFQFFNLVPTLSALENAALPALLDGQPLSKARKRGMELLSWLGIEHRAQHRPHQLSGGEMQRVAIARALFLEPPLILADEPTGNLDSKTGKTVLELLQSLVKERGHTLLMVTHDPGAAEHGSRLIRIRDGRIESDQRK